MSKATRKALAIGAGAALGASSLIGLPAQAAAFDLEIAYAEGSNASVFNSDTMEIDITQAGLIADALAHDSFAIVISNPDSANLLVDFTGTGAVGAETFSVLMVDADGNAEAAAGQTRAGDGIAEGTAEALTFATGDAVLAVLYDFKDNVAADQVPDSIKISRAAADDDYGDDGASISVYTYYDSDRDFTDQDDTGKSNVLDVNFVDPATVSVVMKATRVVADGATYLNENDSANLAALVRFSNSDINLDTIDWTQWQWQVNTDGADVAADNDIAPGEDFVDGFTSHDAYGQAILTFGTNTALAGAKSYQLQANYDGQTKLFSAAAFKVVEASNAGADGIAIELTDSANLLDNGAGDVDVRPGATSVPMTVQIDDGGVDLAVANQPVVVTLTSVAGTHSLSGVSGSAAAGKSLTYSTLTNEDGQVELTVTSSAALGDSYTVEAYLLDTNGDEIASDQAQTVVYTAAALTSWATNTTVATGSSVTITASIEDQYGEPMSTDNTGKAISVGFIATDATDLDEYVAVSGGSASVTFANFLVDGDSDVLTVSAHTGAEDDRTNLNGTLSDITVTLYAELEVAGVTTNAAEYSATVGYSDFGNDVTSADGTAASVSGSVIDSVGAGVPGASVTVSGAGLQFNEGSNWAVGSHTFNADEAGAFSVDVYTHLADDTTMTITSGGKSTTVTIAGALNDGGGAVSAADLVLSWNLAEVVMYNTTYRVDATVTDVWGNAIPNAEVTFAGEAAAQFNSAASVAKNTNASGVATAYLRSLTDVSGLAAVSVTLSDNIDFDGAGGANVTDVGDTFTDDATTSWDESAATDVITAEVDFLTSAPAAAADTKVNAGSFKGYVAIYAKGHEGKRLSAKVGADWVVVPVLASNFERVVEFTGAGYTIAVRIYIDRVLVDTITVTTK
ncbi:MAG: hypothetical protein DCO81_05810 [Candidatus Aquiluna sp. XM-24bin5]|nr:MAG: hypothetical protein DCO81_05810 [Candidatus Aquiluna sp. XM-24bin5]